MARLWSRLKQCGARLGFSPLISQLHSPSCNAHNIIVVVMIFNLRYISCFIISYQFDMIINCSWFVLMFIG